MNNLAKYQSLLTFEGLLAIAFLGMLSNFLTKKVKGETLLDITHYFKNNVRSTITALIATGVSYCAYYFTLSTGQFADFLTAFGIGYMCDSAFNKWDMKKEEPKDDNKN